MCSRAQKTSNHAKLDIPIQVVMFVCEYVINDADQGWGY